MKIVVQPELIERVVFEAARADERLSRRFHRAFARCYDEPDPDRRELAFRRVNEEWFERLGLRDRIAGVVNEFPHTVAHVRRVVVADAAGAKGQSAELFGETGAYSVGLKLYAGLLLRDGDFQCWARHELMHIDDMLDPAFAYDRAHRPTGASAASQNLARERYALLWAMSIDARLESRRTGDRSLTGLSSDTRSADAGTRERRRQEYQRAFGPAGQHAVGAFDELWSRFQTERPSHPQLLAMLSAATPEPRPSGRTPRPEGRGLEADSQGRPGQDIAPPPPVPGSPCPLCRFSTFDWLPHHEIARVETAIRADFPNWTPADGVCGRCGELYRSRTAAESYHRRTVDAAGPAITDPSAWPAAAAGA